MERYEHLKKQRNGLLPIGSYRQELSFFRSPAAAFEPGVIYQCRGVEQFFPAAARRSGEAVILGPARRHSSAGGMKRYPFCRAFDSCSITR